MNKETKPRVLVFFDNSELLARNIVNRLKALEACIPVLVNDESEITDGDVIAISESEARFKVVSINEQLTSLTVCPVDIPDIFKIKQKQRQDAQHWRNGSKKKGGKVGYERR